MDKNLKIIASALLISALSSDVRCATDGANRNS